MQHLFTLDLKGLEVEAPTAAESRLMVVFSDSLFELSPGDEDAVEIVWVSQEQFDAHPETTPPEDEWSRRAELSARLPSVDPIPEIGRYDPDHPLAASDRLALWRSWSQVGWLS